MRKTSVNISYVFSFRFTPIRKGMSIMLVTLLCLYVAVYLWLYQKDKPGHQSEIMVHRAKMDVWFRQTLKRPIKKQDKLAGIGIMSLGFGLIFRPSSAAGFVVVVILVALLFYLVDQRIKREKREDELTLNLGTPLEATISDINLMHSYGKATVELLIDEPAGQYSNFQPRVRISVDHPWKRFRKGSRVLVFWSPTTGKVLIFDQYEANLWRSHSKTAA